MSVGDGIGRIFNMLAARHVMFNLWGCQTVMDEEVLSGVVGDAVRQTGESVTSTSFEETVDGSLIIGVLHTMGHATLCVRGGGVAYADFFSFNPLGWQEFGKAIRRDLSPARVTEKQLDRPTGRHTPRGVRQSSAAYGQCYMNRNGGLTR